MRSIALAAAVASLAFGSVAVSDAHAGSFKSHKNYKVSGSAKLVKSGSGYAVRLSGFRTSSGPDLYVYVGQGGPSRRVAKLRRNSGSQTYKLPAGLSPANVSTVHIHCKRFNSTFGTARVN